MLHEYNTVGTDAVVGLAEGDAEGLRTGHAAVEILDEDIVVSAVLHLGEGNGPAPAAHAVQIHQLGIALAVAGGNAVGQGPGGIQRGKAGNAKLHGAAVQSDVVAHGAVLYGAGIDDELQPRSLAAKNLFGFKAFHRQACPGNGGRGAFGAAELQPQLVEAPGEVQDFRIIRGLHTEEHLVPGRRNVKSGSGEALVHGFGETSAEAQNFARGLHLGAENGVCIREFFKREHGDLYGIVGRGSPEAGAVAQILQFCTQHDP